MLWGLHRTGIHSLRSFDSSNVLYLDLVSEISLLIHPVNVGENAYPVFGDIHANITLTLIEHEIVDDGYT